MSNAGINREENSLNSQVTKFIQDSSLERCKQTLWLIALFSADPRFQKLLKRIDKGNLYRQSFEKQRWLPRRTLVAVSVCKRPSMVSHAPSYFESVN